MTFERNWAGNMVFSPSSVARPDSIDQLQEVVATTARSGRGVRASAARHTFSALGSTDGVLVVMDELSAVVGIDHDLSTVTVEAGIRYAALAPWLHAHGFALANLASLPHLSVGGAIATATHGSGDGNQNLAGAVTSIELVDASGQLRRIERGTDEGSAAIVGLGGFGVVARVTLHIEPTFEVAQDVLLDLPFDEGVAQLDEILGSAYSVSLFTDWRSDVFHQVWCKQRADPSTSPAVGGRFGAACAPTASHPVRGGDAAACTEQLGRPGAWHERLPHFRADAVPSVGAELQSEYFVDRADAHDALDALRPLRDLLAGLVLVTELRSVAADEFWLSPAYGRDSLGIHFTWRPEPDFVARAIEAVEHALEPFHARPHWAKLSSVSAADLRDRFPRLVDAARTRDVFDPSGVFRNDFLDRSLSG